MVENEGDALVLVAEDDESLRTLMVTALRRRRVNVESASDGAEAIAQLETRNWGVLVLDLMMPGTSGWDVIAWLAAHRDRMPKAVIVVSAADREVLRELDPTVVNAIVFKPFDLLQLTSYIKAAAELKRPDRRHRRQVQS